MKCGRLWSLGWITCWLGVFAWGCGGTGSETPWPIEPTSPASAAPPVQTSTDGHESADQTPPIATIDEPRDSVPAASDAPATIDSTDANN